MVAFVQRGKTVILVTICLLLTMVILLQDRYPSPSSSSSATRTPSAATTATNTAATMQGSSSSSTTTSMQNADAYRLEDDLVLITKVGSATVHKRLLIHLAEQSISNLYIPNRLYVSDYPLQLTTPTTDNITFFDALANVSSTISGLDEFKSLRGELKALIESNQDLDDMSAKDGGWKLDKYKFLPMVAEAWRRFPGKKWYVVVEADTFLFYNQLVRWLSTLDASQQYLLGHPTFCDYDGKSTMFTHGGSGIVLSQGIMQASFGADQEFEHSHDDLIQKSAFGDALLSKSIYDSPQVHLTELSPEGGEKFNSDPPRVLKFTRNNWCSPIMSFHHITPTDAAHLYDFQRRIEPKLSASSSSAAAAAGGQELDLVRWGDVWDEFIPNFLRQAMEQVGKFDADSMLKPGSSEPGEVGVIGWQAIEDWDSETTDLVASSADECQAQCRADPNCLMWEWRKGQGERDQVWADQGRRVSRRKRSQAANRLDGDIQERNTNAEWGKCRFTSDFLRIGLTKPKEASLTTGWMGTRIDRWRKDLECSGRTGLNSYSADLD